MDAVTQRLINTVSSAGGGGGGGGALYSDDVFSSCVYDGKSGLNQIVNKVDLQNNGGLVWIKERGSANVHNLWDSGRGIGAGYLQTNDPGFQIALSGIASFNNDGFTLQGAGSVHNSYGMNYASMTFRKAAKFFDIVTWTGDNTANRVIPHALNCAPGLIIVKAVNNSNGWFVWHRSLASLTNNFLKLHLNGDVETSANLWGAAAPTDSSFQIAQNALNLPSAQYVAYVFAHDTATDGIVKCGTFTTGSQGQAEIDLGWEPQFLMVKSTSVGATFKDWLLIDDVRDFTTDTTVKNSLKANAAVAEAGYSSGAYSPTPKGFKSSTANANQNTAHIYLAIRRPTKPPTSGADVFHPLVRTGIGVAAKITGIGFKPDMVLFSRKAAPYGCIQTRLTGCKKMQTTTALDEISVTDQVTSFDNDGISVGNGASSYGINASGASALSLFFRRAPGFFDVLNYAGSSSNDLKPHSLKVPPELIIFFKRAVPGSNHLVVFGFGPTYHNYGVVNTSGVIGSYQSYSAYSYMGAAPTSESITLGNSTLNNDTSAEFLALLFATKAGISKVGTYTGNGNSQNINCGFTTGARFVLVKRMNAVGSWYIFDTARGISAGADPSILLDSWAAEVTTVNSINPEASGFTIVQETTNNLNVLNSTYLFLAIA